MYYAEEKRIDFTFENPMAKDSVMVWAGVSATHGVLGPFFLDAPVTGMTYLALLEEKVRHSFLKAYVILQSDDSVFLSD